MTSPPVGPKPPGVAPERSELDDLQAQIEAARAQLTGLLRDVAEAESHLGSVESAQLLEANEHLVVTALRSQSDAEAAARAYSEVSRVAGLDVLTELPNRALFRDRLDHAIAGARRHGSRLALLFLDLDGFKQINDTYGHAAGDDVLKRVARCLLSSVREVDTVSRHGGDEFLVLLTGVAEPADAALVADKVIAALGVPGPVGDRLLPLKASVGIGLFPDDGDDAGTLMERADAAMYRAKRRALGRFVFHGDGADSERSSEPAALPAPPHRAADDHRPAAPAAHERSARSSLDAQRLGAGVELARQRHGERLATLAHELRESLQPTRAASAMLGRLSTGEPTLSRVTALVDRRLRHVDRLLGLLTTGPDATRRGRELVLEPTPLAAVVETALAAWRPALAARRQRIEARLPSVPLHLDAHPEQLAFVVGILLDTVSRSTADGGSITLAATAAGADVVLSAVDDGAGSAPEALPSGVRPSVSEPPTASGSAGLAVLRQIVEAHRGSVATTPAASGGTCIAVTLPLRPEPGATT